MFDVDFLHVGKRKSRLADWDSIWLLILTKLVLALWGRKSRLAALLVQNQNHAQPSHTTHQAFWKRRACRTRPHMHVRAAGALSCEAVCGATGERVLAMPVSRRWSDRAHAAARGNPDESVAADASGASHGARRAHARERCGACWSSAQRAPEPAYARVT
jgi:hypothetical protein